MGTSDHLVVVGDRFEEFLANPGTIAASRFRASDTGSVTLVAGQGLSAELLAEMGAPVPVRRELTHKRLAKNVMIGEPSSVGGRYVAPLVLDERCETLEDHLTGQHIPAVALIEAARQTWTAVTETFFPSGLASTRFVIDELRSRFRSFVLPLPALLVYRVLSHERGPVQQLFHGSVEISQSGVVAAEFDVRFRVIMRKLSAKQEALVARQALTELTSTSDSVIQNTEAS